MAFDRTLIAHASASLTSLDVPINWTYTSPTDALATIRASAYFNEFSNQLTKNDWLYIVGTDGADLVNITSTTGATPVTVAEFITTTDIADGSITLPKLATGISPSHVVKFGAKVTTAGGAAAEAFTVTGALATDVAAVVMQNQGAVARTILEVAVTTDTLTVTFSADPSTDHVIYYQIFRAAV